MLSWAISCSFCHLDSVLLLCKGTLWWQLPLQQLLPVAGNVVSGAVLVKYKFSQNIVFVRIFYKLNLLRVYKVTRCIIKLMYSLFIRHPMWATLGEQVFPIQRACTVLTTWNASGECWKLSSIWERTARAPGLTRGNQSRLKTCGRRHHPQSSQLSIYEPFPTADSSLHMSVSLFLESPIIAHY